MSSNRGSGSPRRRRGFVARAREQMARCDEVWVVGLPDAVYGDMAKAERLWPASYASFRRRWDAIGAAMGVATSAGQGMSPPSLRGGGALTEDLTPLQH